MPSFQEATACPRCGLSGRPSGKRPQGRATLHVFTCENSRCRWYDTEWLITVLPDGTIPEREPEERGSQAEREMERRRRAMLGKAYTDRLEEELNRPTGPGTMR